MADNVLHSACLVENVVHEPWVSVLAIAFQPQVLQDYTEMAPAYMARQSALRHINPLWQILHHSGFTSISEEFCPASTVSLLPSIA